MKKLVMFAIVAMALCISCNKEEKPVAADIDWNIPSTTVAAGAKVQFVDNTLDVKSRTWTFEDGTPATSSNASVEVVFAGKGNKKVSLEVTFTNGATDTKEATVNVAEAINGEITVSSTTSKGCIRIGEEVTFSIANPEGTISKYEWSFVGGTPATSTEASPKVIFDSRVREMVASCKISNDGGASAQIEKTFVVGNLPVNRTWPDLDYDGISFEGSTAPSWICYRGDNVKDAFSIENTGACGTSHSLKVSLGPIVAASPEDDIWADIFPRDSWGCNAPLLEAGNTYELSFWMKSDKIVVDDPEIPAFGVGCIQIIGWLDDWMSDPTFGKASESWGETFGMTYEKSNNVTLYNDWWNEETMVLDGTEWTHVSVEFTPDQNVTNVYPYFRIYPMCEYVLFDEIEINLVEE